MVLGREFWTGERWRLERFFVPLLVLWASLSLTRVPAWVTMPVSIALAATGSILAWRYVRTGIRKTIWRLRNRLIVTYVFIGVVPVLLILVLVGLGSYIIFGQVAEYLITTELERRTKSLWTAALSLAQTQPAMLGDRVAETGRRLAERFPGIEIFVDGRQKYRYPAETKLEPLSEAWGDYSGMVDRGGVQLEAAHLRRGGADITLVAPLSAETLSTMIPGMAEVQFLTGKPNQGVTRHLPEQAQQFDYEIDWTSSPRFPDFRQPKVLRRRVLAIATRPSAVVNTVFNDSFGAEQAEGLYMILGVAGIFLVVEIGSAIMGFSLTRTMTSAVHELYEGTERIRAGDFSHRIRVAGTDQLAELATSFNGMTENLQRLIVVAKEKERLESEIEIARGVQNQLFPKAAPSMRTIQLSGACQPARMVSGDYYDFLCLPDGNVAIAIGDVAGKGIAAALLMASIQSIMRTQLTAGIRSGAPAGAQQHTHSEGAVSRMVEELNRQLYANTSPEKYATFCFGLYDEECKTLTYTNAGHLPPILLRNGELKLLEVTGTVVGAFPKIVYGEEQIAMGPEDILVCYTDGIVEPENVYGEEFGTARMMDLVVKYQNSPSDEIIARIMEAVPAWTGSSELSDDMTVVLARRLG